MHSDRSLTRLTRVLDYIENNLGKDLDLNTLADVSHWSRWQLQRVFNEHTGLSVAQYVRQLRLSQSASHLIGSNSRHIDIAMNAGFNSEISFIRTFRNFFGCTPKEYRRRGRPEGIRFPLTDTSMHSIRLENRPAFTLQGISQEVRGLFFMQPNVKKVAPLIWADAKQHLSQHQGEYSPPFAVIDVSRQQSKYVKYWVGVEHLEGTPPLPFNTLTVPEQLYAVVTHRGPLRLLSEAVAWFIVHWLLHSPYRAFPAFDIEEYIEFDEENDIFHVDYWVPIKPIDCI